MVLTWLIKEVFYNFSIIYRKGQNTNLTYYQWNRDVILNRSKDYYENNKEWLRKQARDKYRNLSGEEKNKKREYGINRCRNMSEEEKKTKRIKRILVKLKSLNI